MPTELDDFFYLYEILLKVKQGIMCVKDFRLPGHGHGEGQAIEYFNESVLPAVKLS